MNAIVLSRMLGWVSAGIGLLEIAAPSAVARGLGLPGGRGLVRGYGLRELIAAMTILGKPWEPRGAWSRVFGDAMDLATLAAALGPDNRRRANAGAAALTVGAIAVLDLICAVELTQAKHGAYATARRNRFAPRSTATA